MNEPSRVSPGPVIAFKSGLRPIVVRTIPFASPVGMPRIRRVRALPHRLQRRDPRHHLCTEGKGIGDDMVRRLFLPPRDRRPEAGDVMTRILRRWGLVATLCLTFVVPASAQNDRQPSGERGTELDGLVGAGATSTHTGPLVAGVAGWRLASWARAEARGAWLARGTGADAFAADLGAAINMATVGAAAPYVSAGMGLYRASFDADSAPMSTFYRRRLSAATVGGQSQSFTDPAFRVSAGVDWRLSGRLSVRPEVSALFVRRDGRGETLGLVGVRIGYRFEDRVVTP